MTVARAKVRHESVSRIGRNESSGVAGFGGGCVCREWSSQARAAGVGAECGWCVRHSLIQGSSVGIRKENLKSLPALYLLDEMTYISFSKRKDPKPR
jgi:hypothetical protein